MCFCRENNATFEETERNEKQGGLRERERDRERGYKETEIEIEI